MDKNPVPSNFEDKVRTVTRMPLPDSKFVDALWGKLNAQASQRITDKPGLWVLWQRIFGACRTTWKWSLSLAALAALLGFIVFSMSLLPKNASVPVTSNETPTLRLTTSILAQEPTQDTPSPVAPTPVPIPNRLVDGVCNIPVSQSFDGQYLGRANPDNLERLAGGGSADSGDFTFEIWLACGTSFGHQAHISSHYSEIDGLGILAGWNYHGAPLDGETRDYQGFEPFIQARSSSGGVLSSNSLDFGISGIQFPFEIIPDFSQADTLLRYVVKVRTPDGKLAGAALTFVLQRQPEGYKPVDIHVDPLSENDLQIAESPASVQPPFPTINPEALYPELKAIRELMDRYQNPLRSAPGWVYIKVKNEDPGGNGLYGSLTEWTSEEWLQLDTNGYVIVGVHIDRRADGQIIQQSYSKDRETHNLTYGTSGPYTPYRLDLGGGLYNDLFRQLQAGMPIDRQETTVEGKKAWAFAFTDSFTEPVKVENILTAALRRLTVIDQESGAQLYSEMVGTTPEGEEQLDWRHTYETVERIPQPPEEVLALLGQTPGPYQPPASEGAPAPAGFDPSQSELTLRSFPGDNFDQPTFWVGDIYAGSYLLGRVNFGASPGGYCDRSADGSKLAFNFLVINNNAEGHEYLHWLDLHDVSKIFDPAPDLELISKVAWAPQGSRLAFSACKTGRSACGLYFLDADANQVDLLSTDGVGYTPPIWKPDGSQIASISTDVNNVYTLYIVDAITGKTIYQGLFNADTWQAGADAPTNDWGVEIPRGYTGSSCFKTP